VALRLVSVRLPARVLTDVEVRWRRDGPSPEREVEAALKAIDPTPHHDRFELIERGEVVRRSWRIKAGSEVELKALASRLCALPGVTEYVLDPRDD
jgi:putative Mg2+ transporter-C (MgtC) family protein